MRGLARDWLTCFGRGWLRGLGKVRRLMAGLERSLVVRWVRVWRKIGKQVWGEIG